ncbi:DNA cytosine methyltransferase [Neisseriaceae bacterium CLB008]
MKNLTLGQQMRQQDFGFRDEVIIDLFAGGGGASVAIEQATGLFVDAACNHDEEAIAMHTVNHPQTKHYQADVFEVDPREACAGYPVGLLHLSPDCTHHSQAAGGQPRDKVIRSLAWVGKRWAGQVKPRVITLENVEQILKWGPLVAKRDKVTGRVIKLDRSVAKPGEYVPLSEQFLVPNKKAQGKAWKEFVNSLRRMGYAVEWRVVVAADYGAPTTRKRLFMVARCDGQPIVWPVPTHFEKPQKGQLPWRTAAECIDFSNTGTSIFERKRELAEATKRRIAKGIQKFVLDNPQPFIVPIAHFNGSEPVHSGLEPLRTITATPKGGSFAVAMPVYAPVTIQMAHGEGKGATKRRGIGSRAIDQPLNTVTASGGTGVATAYLMQANGGFNTTVGRAADAPMTTITNTGSQQQLVSAFIERQFRTGAGADISKPLQTIMTKGAGKCGLVECELSGSEDKALRVASFMINYYGNGDARDLARPLDTITTKDRLALVTVHISGEPYLITDIRLRMLEPKELYKAQGFPDTYIFDRDSQGRPFTKTAQVRMCGNSVSRPPYEALVRANYQPLTIAALAVA